MTTTTALFLVLTTFIVSLAQGPPADRQQFIRTEAPIVILRHVRVVDGTGAPPTEDQSIIISDGKIKSIVPGNNLVLPANAAVLDLPGYTVLPGLVGMHDHMFFPMGGTPPMYSNMGTSFPRLYLALGVTTIRTTGSVAPYTDLEIKRLIDTGRMIGPKMHITGPYLEGVGSFTPVMHTLTGPDDARKMVNFWADQGATSFKAYMNITRDELRAAVEEAHKRGLKVTGHLCSIGFREAAEIGIDNLEHGLLRERNNPHAGGKEGRAHFDSAGVRSRRAFGSGAKRTNRDRRVECGAESSNAECNERRRARALPDGAFTHRGRFAYAGARAQVDGL